MINISKKDNLNPNNCLKIYNLNKKDRGKYLNTWFHSYRFDKTKKKVQYLHKEYMTTLIKVDKQTSSQLYGRSYNPFFISITYNIDKTKLYLLARICSIDDSSFGIWAMTLTYEEILEVRFKIMLFISSQKEVNGEEFLKFCIKLGMDKNTIDYN